MAQHTVTLTMGPIPWPFRLVYRARGMKPPRARTPHRLGALVPARFRRFHRWYAGRLGFFWISCMLCKRGFAGHEICGSVPDPLCEWSSYVVCPFCTVERNRKPRHGHRNR